MALIPNTYHVAKITEESLQKIAVYNNGVAPKIEETTTYFIFGGSYEDDYYAIITEEEFLANYHYMYASDQGCMFRSVMKNY